VTTQASPGLDRDVLQLDATAEVDRIAQRLRQVLRDDLRKRGLVVAMSGGIDSSVSAALAVQAVGSSRVFGLLLPEQDSSSASRERGELLARHLDIRFLVQDIAPVLQALGCYRWRDDAIRAVFPGYGDGWKSKIVIAGGIRGQFNHFLLVVQSPDGEVRRERLGPKEYLQIVAATNYKQRVRKAIEYFHADRLNYAVVGTPNRLEYDQGFFVKNGDGAADVKPIAHLYKTQVYALARRLGLPAEICGATPTTDTYSMPQGQDEFYFALPYQDMDLALWAYNRGLPAQALAAALGIDGDQAQMVYRDIEAKRRATRYLQLPPLLLEAVPEIERGAPSADGGLQIEA
jgi:NAD+ synthase